MVKIKVSVDNEPLACELYFDGYYLENLKILNQFRKHDFDVVGLFTGEEGAGKTTLALQSAYYMDKNFSNKNIVFNANQFETAITTLPKSSVIVWDEADDIGVNWASEILVSLKKGFKRIRKNNFVIFLVTPTFHDLNKYFTIHRTRFLVDVRTEKLRRGFFRFYNKNAKKMLYIKGKKEMNMDATRCNFYGRFTNYPKDFPLDLEAYENAKDEATRVAMERGGVKDKDIRIDIYKELCFFLDNNNYPYQKKDIATILGVDTRTIYRYKREVGFDL